jgi:hypothetical protein
MEGPGRPTLYREEFAEQAYKLCLVGSINADLAKAFEVSPRTIDNWLQSHQAFADAVRRGRLIADGDVAHGLYRRAVGYTYTANKVLQWDGEPFTVPYAVHSPPDVRAAMFWLRNRQPSRWREDRKLPDDAVPDGPVPADREGRNWWPGAAQLDEREAAETDDPTPRA